MNKDHWLLCHAEGFDAAQKNVLKFFKTSILLRYDAIVVDEPGSFPAEHKAFWPELERGVSANRSILQGFVDELQTEGCRQIADVVALPLGYPSKLLHIIAHLVDGFIGIDSVFYNLVEDSHGVSDGLRESIKRAPGRYWLIHVEASFRSPSSAALIHQVNKY